MATSPVLGELFFRPLPLPSPVPSAVEDDGVGRSSRHFSSRFFTCSSCCSRGFRSSSCSRFHPVVVAEAVALASSASQ